LKSLISIPHVEVEKHKDEYRKRENVAFMGVIGAKLGFDTLLPNTNRDRTPSKRSRDKSYPPQITK
jgi:hypothetical protein